MQINHTKTRYFVAFDPFQDGGDPRTSHLPNKNWPVWVMTPSHGLSYFIAGWISW